MNTKHKDIVIVMQHITINVYCRVRYVLYILFLNALRRTKWANKIVKKVNVYYGIIMGDIYSTNIFKPLCFFYNVQMVCYYFQKYSINKQMVKLINLDVEI